MIPLETALSIVTIFLETPFEPGAGGGRHARRIAMIE
jgi:ribose 5-phosphate isomerase RpiB